MRMLNPPFMPKDASILVKKKAARLLREALDAGMLEYSSDISRALLGRIHDSEIQTVCLHLFWSSQASQEVIKAFQSTWLSMHAAKEDRKSFYQRQIDIISQSITGPREAGSFSLLLSTVWRSIGVV
jgi:hypothetical protein